MDLRFPLDSRRRFWTAVAALVIATGAVSGSEDPPSDASPTFVQSDQFGDGYTVPVAWADHDLDGDLDLAVGNFGQGNHIYANRGDGSFDRTVFAGGGDTFVVLWADVDEDGDPDLTVGNDGWNLLLTNNGDGSFVIRPEFGSNATVAMAWADFDLDGDLDMAMGNGILGEEHQNLLFVNNSDGTFTEQGEFGRGQTASLAWGDCDGDGDPDLAVGNGGFGFTGQNLLFLNDGDGGFTGRLEFGERDTTSVAWADFDNDGDLDLATGNWGDDGRNSLWVSAGDCTFSGRDEFGAGDTNTIAWGDADNDGDLDLAVGNGDFESAEANALFLNNGDGTFAGLTEFGEGSTDSVAWADVDADGDLDLAVGNEHHPTQNWLFLNQTDPAGYLIVKLVGHAHDRGPGYSNRDGIGAKISVYEAGWVGDSEHLLGFREVAAHGGFSSQSQVDAHFGLEGHSVVDVRVIWPGSRRHWVVQDIPGVAIGQVVLVHEDGPLHPAPRNAGGRVGGP